MTQYQLSTFDGIIEKHCVLRVLYRVLPNIKYQETFVKTEASNYGNVRHVASVVCLRKKSEKKTASTVLACISKIIVIITMKVNNSNQQRMNTVLDSWMVVHSILFCIHEERHIVHITITYPEWSSHHWLHKQLFTLPKWIFFLSLLFITYLAKQKFFISFFYLGYNNVTD